MRTPIWFVNESSQMTNCVLCPYVDQSWTYCPSLDIHLNLRESILINPMKNVPKRTYVEMTPIYDCRS